MKQKQRGILVVSFGTSYRKARERTIHRIEAEIGQEYTNYTIYKAYTSQMIIKKLWERDKLKINTVREAMRQMIDDGIQELAVQPTHIINGIENEIMKKEVLAYQDSFASICFGTPLLTDTADQASLAETLMGHYQTLNPDTDALVLMGHGTTHYSNTAYAALDYTFKDLGYPHVFVGTVEAYPALKTLLKKVKESGCTNVTLSPLMLVAGDHARNDLAGDHGDSWKTRFEQAGFSVTCHLKGLGEYPEIRKMFLNHLGQALNHSY